MAAEPSLDLALALATLICHDLAGTAGALGAAVQMATGGQDEDALTLAADCAGELTARLRLLRAAYSTDGVDDLASLLPGLPGCDRLSVDLSGWVASDTIQAGARARLAANLLLLAARSLPRGGAIRLASTQGVIRLDIAGPRAAWPGCLAQCLADPGRLRAAACVPREAGVAIACLLASSMGMRVTLETETNLRIA